MNFLVYPIFVGVMQKYLFLGISVYLVVVGIKFSIHSLALVLMDIVTLVFSCN